MSLFVCQKCNSIDNTATCSGDHSPTIYTAIVEDLNDFYPNMGGQDMDGHGDEDIVVNGVVWKKLMKLKDCVVIVILVNGIMNLKDVVPLKMN